MNEMKLSDFNYELPQELIAQDPLLKRSDSRLMVLNRATGGIEHRHFSDVIEYLNPGDCLVINDTKVIPARLIGVKEDTGASIEVLLLKRHDDKVWETLVKPGKKARVGARISFGEGKLVGEVIDIVEEGNRLIRFEYEGIFEEVLDELGTDAASTVYYTPSGGQGSLSDGLCNTYRFGSSTDGRLAFYEGTSGADQREGHQDCKSDLACRTWYVPSSEGGEYFRTSYA